MTLAVETVLAPVDGSDASMRAVEYALAIAERYDAGVHALYVVNEERARDAAFGDSDEDIAAASEAFIDEARALAPESVPLTHSSAYGFSPTMKTRHPGSVVLDAAEDVAVDFIVVPREPVSGKPDEPLGRAAEYVLQYATQPVLSV
ncbi:universal stress protein [Halococcus sp. AFM35]|uniref:universal stress protein n=1 Tax=Halococcus sp. AFM35 TaxID=3421653 RepID=UPI003EC056CB